MKRRYSWAAILVTVVVLFIGCSTPGGPATSTPLPTVDIDATVRISIERTTESKNALESTIAAAVHSTRVAETAENVSDPTVLPVPATLTTVPDTPTTVPETLATVPDTPTTILDTPTPVPDTPTTVPDTPTPIPRTLSLAELVAEVRDSVVQIVTNRGLGSGVIIESDSSGNALILTNNHVIDGTTTINVVYAEQMTYRATLIGADPLRDLAVLRICCDPEFVALVFSDAGDVQLGITVVALGFPLGVDSLRISQGIVSGELFSSADNRFEIQTDAAINPGNSGGPLLLMDGTIAGINTYKVLTSSSGVALEGFGFAVATETLTSVVPSLSQGQLVVGPTPTPHPSVQGGQYIDEDFGFVITPPPRWTVETISNGVLIWDEFVGSSIQISVSFEGDQYHDITTFLDDWTLVPGEGWSDFQIEKEQTIYRSSVDGSTLIMGHEFDTRGTFDQIQYEAFTHWFVVGGWLYQVDLSTPADVWQLPEYSDLRLEQQFASISFHPPNP